MKIIDGRKISKAIEQEIKEEIEKINFSPVLAVLMVGNNPASNIYVSNKIKACKRVGIKSILIHLNENSSQEIVEKKLNKLILDKEIDAILVQLPLPKQIDEKKLLDMIPYEKDADGFSKSSISLIYQNKENLMPCTPSGIIKMLEFINFDLESKNVVIIGRSNIVGKPLALMLLNRNATVTICHSKTKDIKTHTKNADLVISAVGKVNILKKDMIKKGCVVIDVGINKIDGKLKGDVDFQKVSKKTKYITPVPGGVGPMTIVMLLKNTLILAKNRKIKNA